MFSLETPRLILVSTPLEVVQTRLERAGFQAEVPLGDTTMCVAFPSEWPGDALALFPRMAQSLRSQLERGWEGVLIEPVAWVAVGQMGFRGLPDREGTVELGYGVNPAYGGRGYATEMVGELVAWALGQPTVRRVTAECLAANGGSTRVLEKTGFGRVGTRVSAEGPLILWARTD